MTLDSLLKYTKKLVVGSLIVLMSYGHGVAETTNTTATALELKQDLSDNNSNTLPEITPLTILDASELIIDGASTLVVTFSEPLDPKQNFADIVSLNDKNKGNVDGAWELSDNGLELRHRYLSPDRELILNINKQIRASNGAQLTEPYEWQFTTKERKPMIGFASKGLILPSQSKTGLPVMTLNIDRVDVNFYRIKADQLARFFTEYNNISQVSIWNSNEVLEYTDLVYSGRFDLKPRRNVQENMLLDLSNIAEFKKEGVYIAVMHEAGKYTYRNPVTIFSISNIGLSIHSYQDKGFAVFTQSLDTGKPLANVKIFTIHNRNDEPNEDIGVTNKNGFLSSSVDITDPNYHKFLIATDGKQTSFIELGRNALDLSEFGITGSTYYDKQLFTFGPRDLYRPGETVYINGLLRDADGKPLPEQPLKVKVFTPSGGEVADFILKPEDNNSGFYQTEYVIPADAETGKWAFGFNVGDNQYRRSEFSVEEFLPERMAMEISPPSKTPILNSHDLSFSITGRYLYGSPAARNELQGNVFLKTQRKIEGLNGFVVGSLADTALSRHLTGIRENLDKYGETNINIDSSYWENIKSPVDISLQISLLDAGGRPVTRTVKQTIWPAEKIPAIRALFNDSEYYDWYLDRYVTRPTVDKGSLAEFEIAYLDIDGNKIATNSLVARIIKERKDYYWSWSDHSGWQLNYNEKEFVISEQRLSIDDNDITKFSFITDDWGSYRFEVIDPNSKILTSMRFWSGYNWSDNTNGTSSVRPDQVKLSINKLSYQTGDTAIVHVEAPTSGSGYIAVESNDGILWSKNINVPTGGLDVKIPIADWKRHDIYLSAVIVRPSKNAQVQTVKRAVGLLYLPINIENRQLNVSINAPEKVQPEHTVSIKVKVDQNDLNPDKELFVLMSAVDSGVLNITKFITPDPFTSLLGKKRYNVDQYDMYGKLIEGKGKLISMSFGGDSDEDFNDLSRGGKKPVSEVNIIAQQLKTIKLDENGEGVFEFTLPDFNGELRLMAQVWGNSRFGKAERTMLVASPLVAELSTPRFLSGGDKSVMALELHNLSKQQQQLTLAVTTEGLLQLENTQTQSLVLEDNERRILQIPIIADYGYGQGKINIKIDGLNVPGLDETQISRTWTIGVRPGYASDLRSYSLTLAPQQEWNMPSATLTDLIPNTIATKLAISDQPPLNIGQYITSLFAYPYGCLEQTTSGLYPSLYANKEQLMKLGIKTDSDDNRHRKIEIGIERILNMQRNNGSFSLWTKDGSEEHWLTVYATDFLLRARERGYAVNDKALEKALTRIGEYLYDNYAFNNLDSYYNDRKDYIMFATKSYAALVLSQQNKITPAVRNGLTRLYKQAESNSENIHRAALPFVQLAIATKNAGYIEQSEHLMTIALNTERSSTYYWLGDYGSKIRDTALIVALLKEHNLYTKEQANHLFSLSNQLKNKRYFSTQELNSLFLAGWQLNNPSNQETAWNIIINDHETTSNKPLMRSYRIDSSTGLTLKNPSTENPLYIKLDVSGYSQTPPLATSASNTLSINRRYYDIQGNPTSINNMEVGDLVVVVLEVNAKKPINDALVVDLLPAGLELENQNLADSSVNINSLTEINELLKDESSYDIKYQEYRDDRYVAAININNYISTNLYRKHVVYLARAVTLGSYAVPASYVESMYNPEWFAIGNTINKMRVSDKSK